MNKKYLNNVIDKDINKYSNYDTIINKINNKINYSFIKYAFAPVVFILIIFLSFHTNFNNDKNTDIININKKECLNNNFILSDFNHNAEKSVDIEEIIEKFELNKLKIPETYSNIKSYIIVDSNADSVLRIGDKYTIEYSNASKSIKLVFANFSDRNNIISSSSNELYSIINGENVIIDMYDDKFYNITFFNKGNYYNISSNNVSLSELIDIIKSIIN